MSDAVQSTVPAEMVSGCGRLGGPSYRYRGAIIDGNLKGTLFCITLPGYALDSWKGMCRLEDARALVDAALGPLSEE